MPRTHETQGLRNLCPNLSPRNGGALSLCHRNLFLIRPTGGRGLRFLFLGFLFLGLVRRRVVRVPGVLRVFWVLTAFWMLGVLRVLRMLAFAHGDAPIVKGFSWPY
jgi:hypothetical protein